MTDTATTQRYLIFYEDISSVDHFQVDATPETLPEIAMRTVISERYTKTGFENPSGTAPLFDVKAYVFDLSSALLFIGPESRGLFDSVNAKMLAESAASRRVWAESNERRERAELARLKAKYEPDTTT